MVDTLAKECVPVESRYEDTTQEIASLENIKTEHVVIERDVRKGHTVKLLKDTSNKTYILRYDEIDDTNGVYPDSFIVRFKEEALESIVSILRAELENNSEW